MKNIILGFTLFAMIVLSLGIVFAMGDKNVRQNEVRESLNTAIESTMEHMYLKKTYPINSEQEFINDFLQTLLIQMESDSDITVNILEADMEKGLLSVEVIERFKYANGREGSVSFVKTCILDSIQTDSTPQVCSITFKTGTDVYKQYTIKNGDSIIMPKNPTKDGAVFVCWLDGAGNEFHFYDPATGEKVPVKENLVLTAKFQ